MFDNVSRFLRYMQPRGDEPTMDFLTKSTETLDYLKSLQRTDMNAATVLNYVKNIIRFTTYLETRLDLDVTDPHHRSKIESFKKMMQTLKRQIAQQMSGKRKYDQFIEGPRSVKDCQEILRVAKADFLNIFKKTTIPGLELSDSEKTIYHYYCEAVMVFRHFQCPRVVEGLTVCDWGLRKPVAGRVVVGIKQHKTATTRVWTFALTQEEEAWFQAYYEFIRPADLQSDCDRFFVSSNGRPVHGVTTDIHRLHESYKLKPSTSHEIRRAAEAKANIAFTESQREDLANYMSKQKSRMQVLKVLVATATQMDTLGDTSPSPDMDRPAPKDFSEFLARFPVSTDGQPPSKRQRTEAGFLDDRVFYDRWRSCQYAKREKYLLSHFTDHKPSVEKVSRLIEEEGWKANHPEPEFIVQRWRPAPKLNIETDKILLECVSEQTWKGLTLKDFGKKVVATRNFSQGDIVCDYHGEVITDAEGRARLQNRVGAEYLFFFKAGQTDLCIDAQACECHPNTDAVGRRINHSHKNPNLQPVHCILNMDGEDVDVIFFKALKDIKVEEEVKFDYGARKSSFRGAGLNLNWLDK